MFFSSGSTLLNDTRTITNFWTIERHIRKTKANTNKSRFALAPINRKFGKELRPRWVCVISSGSALFKNNKKKTYMIIWQFRTVTPGNIYNNCINIYERIYDQNISVRVIQNVIQHFTKTITNLDLSLTSSILNWQLHLHSGSNPHDGNFPK